MGRFTPIAGVLLMVCACGSTPADAPASDDGGGSDPIETSTSSGGETAETTVGDPAACERSNDCEDDGAPHCVASYDPGTGTIGAGTCVSSCVEAGDLARACVDDDSCCEGLCNPVDGFCAAEPAGSTTTFGTSTGTSETDTDGTGSTSGGSGSSSSSTGGG